MELNLNDRVCVVQPTTGMNEGRVTGIATEPDGAKRYRVDFGWFWGKHWLSGDVLCRIESETRGHSLIFYPGNQVGKGE